MGAMIACSACHAVFAVGAANCPNCGLPLAAYALPVKPAIPWYMPTPAARVALIVIGVIVLLSITVALTP